MAKHVAAFVHGGKKSLKQLNPNTVEQSDVLAVRVSWLENTNGFGARKYFHNLLHFLAKTNTE